jgi:hypothetical protein
MALTKGSKFQFNMQGQSLRLAQVLLTVAPAFITYGYNQAGIGPLATLQTWYVDKLFGGCAQTG